MSAGTLYRSVARMVEQGLIAEVTRRRTAADDERRRYYRITPFGTAVCARAEMRRLAQLLRLARGPRPDAGVRVAMSLYRALLRLYPRSFRVDYGDELTRTFEARHRGQATFVRALAALGDVVPNAIAAHWTLLKQDPRLRGALVQSRTPGFALTAILVVALGIGANTAALAVADYTFFRPFPYHEPDRIVRLYQADGEDMWNYGDLSPANWRDWKEQQHSFTAFGAYAYGSANLVSEAEPRRVETVAATAGMFAVLGVRPIAGRLFAADDTLDAARPSSSATGCGNRSSAVIPGSWGSSCDSTASRTRWSGSCRRTSAFQAATSTRGRRWSSGHRVSRIVTTASCSGSRGCARE
jgi:hypothetical protein